MTGGGEERRPSMHFLISPFGSAGDVHPFLGLALELRTRGHGITFVVNGYFEELTRRLGLPYVELGSKEDFVRVTSHPDLWHPFRSFRCVFRHGVKATYREHYDICVKHYLPGQTVVLTSVLGMGALIAQDSIGIPVVTLHLQPAIIWSNIAPPKLAGTFGPRWLKSAQVWMGERLVIDRTVCPEINNFRAELNLPAIRHAMKFWHSRTGSVCLFPRWYAPPQRDWPPNTYHADFPLWDANANEPLSEEVTTFLEAGDPPLVFTPGSANIFGRNFFEVAVQICDRLNRRGMLLTRFGEQIPSSLPSKVKHFDYVPFSRLLPHAAAIVHHGGIGSTAQAMAAGIPQLIAALAHDQLDNGARVKALGIGDWMMQSRFKTNSATKKLKALLSRESVPPACQDVADRMRDRQGIKLAADTVERLAGSRLRSDLLEK